MTKGQNTWLKSRTFYEVLSKETVFQMFLVKKNIVCTRFENQVTVFVNNFKCLQSSRLDYEQHLFYQDQTSAGYPEQRFLFLYSAFHYRMIL